MVYLQKGKYSICCRKNATRPVGSTSINGLTICAIIAITSLFWNYLQSRRKGSNDLIFIELDYGRVLTNKGGIAECMNEYFSSVFTAENFDNFPSFDQVIKDKDFSLLHCSPKDVSKILNELKQRKSHGPDSIHPMILKNCVGTLAPSLGDVFNAPLVSGMLPHNWELADNIPLHKKGA